MLSARPPAKVFGFHKPQSTLGNIVPQGWEESRGRTRTKNALVASGHGSGRTATESAVRGRWLLGVVVVGGERRR